MDFFSLDSTGRLRAWKDFRAKATAEDDTIKQIQMVQEYWNTYPISTISIDIDRPQQWPTPWEMVYSGTVCDFSKAYLMEQTLILMDDERYHPSKLRLMYVENKKLSEAALVVIYDNKYVLNYEHNQIIDFDILVENCIILQEYTTSNQHKHFIKD